MRTKSLFIALALVAGCGTPTTSNQCAGNCVELTLMGVNDLSNARITLSGAKDYAFSRRLPGDQDPYTFALQFTTPPTGTVMVSVGGMVADGMMMKQGEAAINPGDTSAQITLAPVITPPPTDTDKDGIPDNQDACPADVGVANADPVKNGCPADVPVDPCKELRAAMTVKTGWRCGQLLTCDFILEAYDGVCYINCQDANDPESSYWACVVDMTMLSQTSCTCTIPASGDVQHCTHE